MKTAIVYYSKHHGNTKKLIDAIAQKQEITLIDATQDNIENLEKYNLIGFASGIYYSKFHKSVLNYAKTNLPDNKEVFFIYTYGAKKDGYTKAIKEIVSHKNSNIIGEYGCFGFNTFGPFKLIGGIAKGHPDNQEINNVIKFYDNILKKL